MPRPSVLSRRGRKTQKKEEVLEMDTVRQDEDTPLIKGNIELEKGLSYYWLGNYIVAEKWLRLAVKAQEENSSAYFMRSLMSKYWLGRTLYAQGKFNAAENSFRQVLKGNGTQLKHTEDYPDILDTELWLGSTLYVQNKSVKEQELFLQQTELMRFPALPLQSKAEYPSWKQDVRKIIVDARISLNFEDSGSSKADNAERRKIDWNDEGSRLWTLRQLPKYLFDLLHDKKPFWKVWTKLDRYMSTCPYWEGPVTVQNIESASNHGCSDCKAVLQALQSFGVIYSNRKEASSHLSIQAPLFHGDYISIDVLGVMKTTTYLVQPSLGTYISVNFIRFLPNTDLKVSLSIVASSHKFTSFGSLLRPANKWLQYCTKTHPHCAIPDPTFIPRRVMFVGRRGSNPFLTEDQPIHCQYAALSYCWGSTKDTLMTKRHNLRQHFEKIDLIELPKVFFPIRQFYLHSVGSI